MTVRLRKVRYRKREVARRRRQINTDATSGADLQSADSGGVDPDPRITLDDLREDVVAVWAAENDAGAPVDVNGANRSGCATAGTGPHRGRHLDREHFLQEARDGVAIQHQLVHLSLRWVRSVRS